VQKLGTHATNVTLPIFYPTEVRRLSWPEHTVDYNSLEVAADGMSNEFSVCTNHSKLRQFINAQFYIEHILLLILLSLSFSLSLSLSLSL